MIEQIDNETCLTIRTGRPFAEETQLAGGKVSENKVIVRVMEVKRDLKVPAKKEEITIWQAKMKLISANFPAIKSMFLSNRQLFKQIL